MANVLAQERGKGHGPTNGQVRRYAGLAKDLSRVSGSLIAYNLAYLAFAFLVALGAVAVFWMHPAWYTFALAFIVVSSRQMAVLNCEHECVHRKFVRGRRANDFVGRWLCAAPVGSPYGASKARHLTHHRLLGTPGDPDSDLHRGPDKESRAGLFRHFAGGLVGGYAGMVLMGPRIKGQSPAEGTSRQDLVALVVVQALLLAGFSLGFSLVGLSSAVAGSAGHHAPCSCTWCAASSSTRSQTRRPSATPTG